MKWVKRVLLAVSSLVAVLVVIGFSWERIARFLANDRYPAPGELAAVDGASLHVYCSGEGSPTVVLEAGASMPSVTWAPVQERVAVQTRVCSYDRAGMGWSYRTRGPADAETVARRLRGALDAVGERPPYVLAGHSMGGAYSLVFADLYPDDLAGMVLIDSSDPDIWDRAPEEYRPTDREMVLQGGVRKVFNVLAELGVVRFRNRGSRPREGWPTEMFSTALAFSPQGVAAGSRERAAFREVLDRASRVTSLGDLPLTVLTAEFLQGASRRSDEENRIMGGLHHEMQAELAGLSSKGQHHIIRGADHFLQLDHPDRVAQAILGVVAEARERTGLEARPGDR